MKNFMSEYFSKICR